MEKLFKSCNDKVFLRLTERDGKFVVFVSLREIKSIVECSDGRAYVKFGVNPETETVGFYTAEKFSDISRKIAERILYA